MPWNPIDRASPAALTDARLVAHQAAQLLGIGVGKSLLPPADDDSHTSLRWDASGRRWFTPAIPGTTVAAFLRPADLALGLVDGHADIVAERSLTGLTQLGALAWLREEVTRRGGAGDRMSLAAHYEIPPHEVATGGTYPRAGDHFESLSNWFANGHMMLADALSGAPGDPVLRLWPHHFDEGALIDYGEDRVIGLGFTAGDEHIAEPYLYVSPYPQPEASGLPDLGPVGGWHTEGLVTATLRAEELQRVEDPEATGRDFLRRTIALERTLIGARNTE